VHQRSRKAARRDARTGAQAISGSAVACVPAMSATPRSVQAVTSTWRVLRSADCAPARKPPDHLTARAAAFPDRNDGVRDKSARCSRRPVTRDAVFCPCGVTTRGVHVILTRVGTVILMGNARHINARIISIALAGSFSGDRAPYSLGLA
jgi:hypothetical protein